ncbi:uncharacterized protein [Ptychodera flava]|uniref:uncharacterized protein n=1 Tax=Ptychodera flava TaxID=63121 RepID=UPI00396A23F7
MAEDSETALEPLHDPSENGTQNGKRDICRGILLCLADATSLLAVATTAVVFFWRGTWYIMDSMVNPHNYEASGWLSFVLGFLILLVMHMWQSTLKRLVSKDRPVLWHVLSRLHSYILAFGCINYWRGVWHVWDNYTGDGLTSSLICTFVSLVVLWLLRSSRNASRTPFHLQFDSNHRFVLLTRFRTDITIDVYLYILDLLFTVIVVGTAIVSLWRGVWTCLDNTLFPADIEMSGWTSLGIGYGITLFTYSTQYCTAFVTRRLKKFSRIIFEDIYLSVVTFGIINVWRGIWYLSDVYILPGQVLPSGWITHCLGAVIIFVMGVGRSLLTVGCAIDGEQGDGRGVLYPHYIRIKADKTIRSPYEASPSVTVDMSGSQDDNLDDRTEDQADGTEYDDVEIRGGRRSVDRYTSPWWLSHVKVWYF